MSGHNRGGNEDFEMDQFGFRFQKRKKKPSAQAKRVTKRKAARKARRVTRRRS